MNWFEFNKSAVFKYFTNFLKPIICISTSGEDSSMKKPVSSEPSFSSFISIKHRVDSHLNVFNSHSIFLVNVFRFLIYLWANLRKLQLSWFPIMLVSPFILYSLFNFCWIIKVNSLILFPSIICYQILCHISVSYPLKKIT